MLMLSLSINFLVLPFFSTRLQSHAKKVFTELFSWFMQTSHYLIIYRRISDTNLMIRKISAGILPPKHRSEQISQISTLAAAKPT